MQVQPSPVQGWKFMSTQAKPLQQPEVGEHAWPVPEHDAGAQKLLMQLPPVQQSALVVHAPSRGWQLVEAQARPPSAPGTHGAPLQH